VLGAMIASSMESGRAIFESCFWIGEVVGVDLDGDEATRGLEILHSRRCEVDLEGLKEVGERTVDIQDVSRRFVSSLVKPEGGL
jgi:hypothetical protein